MITGASSGIGRATAIELAQLGAATSIYVASSPEVEGVTGKYFADCREKHPSPASHDEAVAKRLWEVSARMRGLASESDADARTALEMPLQMS